MAAYIFLGVTLKQQFVFVL